MKPKILFLFLLILILAAGLKVWLLLQNVTPFNSDEAVVGLMARHILSGERPVFFYGQAYMGSLDAYLVAFGFAMFGAHVWVIRLVQSSLYLLTIITTVVIGRLAFESWYLGLIAGLLLAVPTVNVTLYTTVSLGGYGEALVLGNLILLSGIWIIKRISRLDQINSDKRILLTSFFWGIVAGIGIWANGLTLIYSVPCGLGLIISMINNRKIIELKTISLMSLFGIAGLMVGATPWLVYAFNSGFDGLIHELFGSAVAVERGAWSDKFFTHLVNFILLGGTVTFGLRPPWEVRWLALPLFPVALAFWIAVLGFGLRLLIQKSGTKTSNALIFGVMTTLTVGFIFTPFGIDPSGRYFVPFCVPLVLIASQFVIFGIKCIRLRNLLLGSIVLFNFLGTLQCVLRFPPGLTTQFYEPSIIDHRFDRDLIDFLTSNRVTCGYTNYWVSYPIAFLSDEKIIFTPDLPYHQDLVYTTRDNRYSPYNDIVQKCPSIGYITTRNPNLDGYLRSSFADKNISWSEKQIGDYLVFYRFSKSIQPQQIGLGITTP